MNALDTLHELAAASAIDEFAVQFATFLARKDPAASAALILRGAELAESLTRQDTCVNLARSPAGALGAYIEPGAHLGDSELVGNGDTATLLTREDGLLYLSRYHRYERAVAEDLLRRSAYRTAADHKVLAEAVGELFGVGEGPDWQRVAAVTAATQGLAVITGGPGTGKTTTVLKLLAAIVACSGDAPPSIALAAPTGKAAARLSAGMRGGMTASGASGAPFEKALAALPSSATTLHRLLGARPFEAGFRYNRANPLPVDILVIDEVSMVDLALFAHTLAALPVNAQLILLGDPDQLPSVEAGNVLQDVVSIGGDDAVRTFSSDSAARIARISGDVVPVDTALNQLQDALVRLETNYRFKTGDSISMAAQAALAGDARALTGALKQSQSGSALVATQGTKMERLAHHYTQFAKALDQSADADELLTAFEAARVLGPRREGPLGVDALNTGIEAALRDAGSIRGEHTHYHGRPILIARNDYNLRLYNGDVGICIVEDDQHLAVFRQPDGSLLRYLTTRLPPHETCFAMTVHKSQGSEFGEVGFVLPPQDHSRMELETRELVYTAITRARDRFVLYTEADPLEAALNRRTRRVSGLQRRLRAAGAPSVARTNSTQNAHGTGVDPGTQLELF